jgi:hypothetical protein
MTTDTTPKKKGRGRPRKVVLVPKKDRDKKPEPEPFGPVQAANLFISNLGDTDVVCVFGIDPFTEELIEQLWVNPHISKIVCSDTSPEKITGINRRISGRSFSMHRWLVSSVPDFLQMPRSLVCAVAKKDKETVESLGHPTVDFVVLEELNVD